jgi:hypothetical protein
VTCRRDWIGESIYWILSQVVSTSICNILKITVTATREITSSILQLFSCLLNSLRLIASHITLRLHPLRERERERERERVTLRLAVYPQSVHLGAKPLETHGQIFLIEHLRSYSLCNILSVVYIAAGPCQRSHSQVRVPRDS